MKKKDGVVTNRRSLAKTWRVFCHQKYLFLMLALPIVFFLIFKFYPMAGIQIAFKNFRVRKGMWNSEWVGFVWFEKYMSEPYFWQLVKNTVVLGVEQIVFTFPIPIIFALLLNEIKSKKIHTLIENITYLPHFISVVIVASMVTLFVARNGIVNDIVAFLGGERYLYMQDPNWFRPLFLISKVWQEIGWSAIIYTAALTGVDLALYEAAIVDGAGRWQQTLHVTIPAILPTVSIMFIMAMGNIMSVSFEKVLLMQNALTYETSDVISTYVYRKGLTGGQYSYSTAIDLFSTVINFSFIVIANRICKRLDGGATLW